MKQHNNRCKPKQTDDCKENTRAEEADSCKLHVHRNTFSSLTTPETCHYWADHTSWGKSNDIDSEIKPNKSERSGSENTICISRTSQNRKEMRIKNTQLCFLYHRWCFLYIYIYIWIELEPKFLSSLFRIKYTVLQHKPVSSSRYTMTA